MSRICTVCASPNREAIDKLLARGECVKRDVARREGLSKDAIQRHEARHLGADLIEAARANLSDNGTDKSLVGRVTRMVDRLEKLAESCTEYGTGKELLAAARELRPYHELFGKANGQLANDRVNAIFMNLNVRDEQEARRRIELTRGMDDVTPQGMCDEIEAAMRLCLPQARDRITSLRRVLEEIEGSYAVEVNGNGAGEAH